MACVKISTIFFSGEQCKTPPAAPMVALRGSRRGSGRGAAETSERRQQMASAKTNKPWIELVFDHFKLLHSSLLEERFNSASLTITFMLSCSRCEPSLTTVTKQSKQTGYIQETRDTKLHADPMYKHRHRQNFTLFHSFSLSNYLTFIRVRSHISQVGEPLLTQRHHF